MLCQESLGRTQPIITMASYIHKYTPLNLEKISYKDVELTYNYILRNRTINYLLCLKL